MVSGSIEFIARKPGLAPCVRDTGQGRGCPIGPATTAKRRTHWPEWSRRAERARTVFMLMIWAFSEAWRRWIVRRWQPRRVGCAGPMPPQTRGASARKAFPEVCATPVLCGAALSRIGHETARSCTRETYNNPRLRNPAPWCLPVWTGAEPYSRNFGRTRQPLRRSITTLLAEID